MKHLSVLSLFCAVLTASGSKSYNGASRIRGLKSSKSQRSSSQQSKKSFKFSKSSKTTRNCKYSATEADVNFKCSAITGKAKDTVEFHLETGESGAEIAVKYKHDNHTEDMHEKTEDKFEVLFYSLIEYTPSGEDLSYEWDEGEIVQTLELYDFKEFSSITKDADGIYHFDVMTEDGVAQFVFKFSEYDNDAMQLSANKIKLDVIINDFPWKQNDTLVALLSTVEAKTKIQSHYHGSKKSQKSAKDSSKDGSKKKKHKHPIDVSIRFNQSTALPFGEFTWVETADVDNNTVPGEVIATTRLEDDNDSKESGYGTTDFIAFSFLNSSGSDLIYWDPEAGVAYDETSTGTMRTSNLGILVSCVAGGLFALLN